MVGAAVVITTAGDRYLALRWASKSMRVAKAADGYMITIRVRPLRVEPDPYLVTRIQDYWTQFMQKWCVAPGSEVNPSAVESPSGCSAAWLDIHDTFGPFIPSVYRSVTAYRLVE